MKREEEEVEAEGKGEAEAEEENVVSCLLRMFGLLVLTSTGDMWARCLCLKEILPHLSHAQRSGGGRTGGGSREGSGKEDTKLGFEVDMERDGRG